MSCCPKTIEWLRKIGAKHAAKMHALGAFAKEWTLEDWYAHMEEEERLMWPYLTSEYQKLLTAEHDIFRDSLRKTGKVPKDLMFAHSKLEDDLIALIVQYGF